MSNFDGRLAEAMDRALMDLDTNTFTPEESEAATRALERLHRLITIDNSSNWSMSRAS